jgi:hypothetical protein
VAEVGGDLADRLTEHSVLRRLIEVHRAKGNPEGAKAGHWVKGGVFLTRASKRAAAVAGERPFPAGWHRWQGQGLRPLAGPPALRTLTARPRAGVTTVGPGAGPALLAQGPPSARGVSTGVALREGGGARQRLPSSRGAVSRPGQVRVRRSTRRP